MPLPDKFTVAGSPEQVALILPILQAMYLGFKELEVSGGGGRESEFAPKRRGKIKVKLLFNGVTDLGKRKSVEIGFRLMNDDPRTITLDRLKYLGQRIHFKFNNWSHQTGKKMVTYADWDKGYQFQLRVPSIAEGQRIIESVLDIQSHSPEWEYLYLNGAVNENERYKDIPDKVQLAGLLVRPNTQRARAVVKFSTAYIKFPHIQNYEKLCDKEGNVIKSLDFLKAYDND